MSTADSQAVDPVGAVADSHALTSRAREYGENVILGDEWPLAGVDLAKVTWATSTRAKRRHGRCSYDGDGHATITLTEHTYDRAGFAACKMTIRHELVHAWQYQHRGEYAIVTDTGIELRADSNRMTSDQPRTRVDTKSDAEAVSVTASTTHPDTASGFPVETGHGDSFQAWVEPLELPGRCSTYYDRRKSDFNYVYSCPDCEEWWGKHRLCKSVRQAAHGGKGSTGYRYCTTCEVLLHLQAGEQYLEHDDHDDETIKTFANGDWTAANSTDKTAIQADVDLSLVHLRDASGIELPE